MSGLREERPCAGVGLVVLDRPGRMNAFDDDLLLRRLPEVFASLDADPEVRAVVVTGEGRGFSAGADLDSSGFTRPTPTESEQFVRTTHRAPVSVRKMATPTIAAVNGAAVGAGLGLALACDLRLASKAARFGAPFVEMGLVPDYGVSYFLPRVVGTATALDLLLSGRLMDADEALRCGLVSRVCDTVVTDAVEFAAIIADLPPQAVTMTRGNVYRAMDLDIDAEILEQEARSQAIALHGSEFPERFARWKKQVRV